MAESEGVGLKRLQLTTRKSKSRGFIPAPSNKSAPRLPHGLESRRKHSCCWEDVTKSRVHPCLPDTECPLLWFLATHKAFPHLLHRCDILSYSSSAAAQNCSNWPGETGCAHLSWRGAHVLRQKAPSWLLLCRHPSQLRVGPGGSWRVGRCDRSAHSSEKYASGSPVTPAGTLHHDPAGRKIFASRLLATCTDQHVLKGYN